jgi:mannose-6-phosphate isomerase-like protein (cupin superfamily)
MKVRHKRYGRVVNKKWGNEIRVVDNEDNNYSGKLLNINQNEFTSTHFHSNKHKTFYVLSGTLTIEVIEPDTAELMSYDVDSEETFEIEQNVAHRLLAKDGGVTVIEVSTYHNDSDVFRVLVTE